MAVDFKRLKNLNVVKNDNEEMVKARFFMPSAEGIEEMGTSNKQELRDRFVRFYHASDESWFVYTSDSIVFYGGYRQQTHEIAIPWSVFACDIPPELNWEVMYATVQILNYVKSKYTYLHNVISADYTRTQKWIRRLGFSIDIDHPITSKSGKILYKFEWKAD